MAEITCEVVKDLLPLYVDDVLSPDSRAIVEEHLSGCAGCTEYYQMLKAPEKDVKQMKNLNDKAALTKIKKSINRKRLKTAIITAVCIAAVVAGLFYGLCIHERYIPYEESGIHVSDDAIRAERIYYASRGIYTPDGETMFLYLTTTVRTDWKKDAGMINAPIIDLTDEGRTMQNIDDNGTVTELVCREIYYIPEEKAKQFMKERKWDDENADQEIADWKESSVLIWSIKE